MCSSTFRDCGIHAGVELPDSNSGFNFVGAITLLSTAAAQLSVLVHGTPVSRPLYAPTLLAIPRPFCFLFLFLTAMLMCEVVQIHAESMAASLAHSCCACCQSTVLGIKGPPSKY